MSEDERSESGETEWPQTRVLENTLYCGVCHLPPEYCTWGPNPAKCKVWLRDNHPDMFTVLWNDADLTAELEQLQISEAKASETAPTLTPKQKKKAEQAKRVTIKRVERTKRKCVVIVTGLDKFEPDLKRVAKLFAQRLATGASVTKCPQGGEEITVQGDCQDDIYDIVLDKFPNVPEEVIELTEDTKSKKKSGGA